MALLRCRCVFTERPTPPAVGTLRVRVVDVSRADASSPVIAGAARDAVSSDDEAEEMTLDVPYPPRDGDHAIQAHLDLDGSGETAVGDFLTMEHIPVMRAALDLGETVQVRLRRVS